MTLVVRVYTCGALSLTSMSHSGFMHVLEGKEEGKNTMLRHDYGVAQTRGLMAQVRHSTQTAYTQHTRQLGASQPASRLYLV